MTDFNWKGQVNIWELNVATRDKFFMWLVMNGRLKAQNFYTLLIRALLQCESVVAWLERTLSIFSILAIKSIGFGVE